MCVVDLSMAEKQDPLAVQRGDYGRNNLATILFVLGRFASGPIQYALIRARPLSYFDVPHPPTGGLIHLFGNDLPRIPFLVALMPGGLSVKQNIWLTCYCRERMTTPFAIFGVLLDVSYETVNSLIFCGAAKNPLFSERYFYTGMAIFYTALVVEFAAELQRVAFKRKPENDGKPCTSGFWSITRHINYTMNVIYGLGYGLATGGPLYSIATAGMYLINFVTNAMPSNEAYCKKKYGRQWEEYEKNTPWQLIPGIY